MIVGDIKNEIEIDPLNFLHKPGGEIVWQQLSIYHWNAIKRLSYIIANFQRATFKIF